MVGLPVAAEPGARYVRRIGHCFPVGLVAPHRPGAVQCLPDTAPEVACRGGGKGSRRPRTPRRCHPGINWFGNADGCPQTPAIESPRIGAGTRPNSDAPSQGSLEFAGTDAANQAVGSWPETIAGLYGILCG